MKHSYTRKPVKTIKYQYFWYLQYHHKNSKITLCALQHCDIISFVQESTSSNHPKYVKHNQFLEIDNRRSLNLVLSRDIVRIL